MSYFQPDPVLDFDDTNAFLAALGDTVPSLEKNPDWNQALDLDSIYTPIFEPKFEPSSPEVISSNGSIDEMFGSSSRDSETSDSLAAFYMKPDDVSGADAEDSCTNSMGSTMSPYLDFSPHSAQTSWQPSPVNEGGVDFGNFAGFGHEGDSKTSFPLAAGCESQQEPSPLSGNPVKLESISPEPSHDLKPQTNHAKVNKPVKKAKTSHNVIEKKYRTSINSKIMELREVVPTLKYATGKTRVSMADLDGLSPACKLNKASILTKANEYIKHMKKKNKALQKKISALHELVAQAGSAQHPLAVSPESQPSVDGYSSFEQPAVSGSLYQRRMAQRLPENDEFFNNYSTYSEVNTRTLPVQQPMPAQQQMPIQQHMPSNQNNNANYTNTNIFFGGLATLMGSSYINDNNFQAMSALPIFPATLFGKSAVTSQLINTLRMCTMGFGLFMMAYSLVGGSSLNPGKGKKRRLPESVSWTLSNIGIRPRESFDEEERNEVHAIILGKKPASNSIWVKTYLRLRTKEANFETMLLQYLVGTVIVKNGGSFSRLVALDLKFKRRTFMDMEYAGVNETLSKIHQMFKTVDGLSLFESEFFAQRLYNLSNRKPICQGVMNGENASLFVDSLLRNENNLYGLIFEWRILEIIHELTLVYLDLLSSPISGNDDGLDELRSDAAKVGALVEESEYLNRQYSYFKLLLAPQATPQVLNSDKKYILNTLEKIDSCFKEPELTDDEEISEDESDASFDDSETSAQRSSNGKPESLYLIKHQKSLVCSLNLMNEEKYIVLLSSLITYYSNKEEHEKSLELLNRLKFKKEKISMSLLSFTCLLQLLSSIVPSSEEDADVSTAAKTSDIATSMSSENCLVVESIIKAMKSWLNDEAKPNFLTNGLRSELSNLIISKGIALNKL